MAYTPPAIFVYAVAVGPGDSNVTPNALQLKLTSLYAQGWRLIATAGTDNVLYHYFEKDPALLTLGVSL